MNQALQTIPSSRHKLLKGLYAAIDTEFKYNPSNNNKPYTLFAASIVDSNGKIQTKHISDFFNDKEPEKELVKWLITEILKYKLTFGWYSRGVRLEKENRIFEGKDSDLKVIDTVCRYYSIPSIIVFDKRGLPYLHGYPYHSYHQHPYMHLNKHDYYTHIDLFQVYKKPLVKSAIYQNSYKNLSLDCVSKAILHEGKLEELDGVKIQELSKDKQLEYVAQDAILLMKLSRHNNFEILDLMNAISIITDVSFDKVCHTGISSWWKKIIESKIEAGKCRLIIPEVEKKKYLGGHVMEPKVGFYNKESIYVLDVKSLYPSMMIAHNISFDTINCKCCTSDPNARVSNDIMRLINSTLLYEQRRVQYWLCRDPSYRGIIPTLLQQFRDERFRQQKLCNEHMQLALKNLINGCYGLFGSEFFPFADYRVAEITTAFGRQTLLHMQHIAKEVYGFDIIYGDTDSIFVTNVKKRNDLLKFIAECLILLDIDVELFDIYEKFLITKKKHYIGISQDSQKDPVIKGMEGIKSDRSPWINRIEKQFADDIKNEKNPLINIRRKYKEMEEGRVLANELEIRLTLKKDPDSYKLNSFQRTIGKESEAEAGDVITYYKSYKKGGGTSNIDFLSRQKYLQMLRTAVEKSLGVMGYDFDRDILGQQRFL